MIKFMKRLWNDRRGNALVIACAAMPMIIGGAGFATDTIQWALWKRQLQRTADSAAMAGVLAEAQGATIGSGSCTNYSGATYSSAVAYDINKNEKLWPTLTCSYENSPASGSYTADKYAVKVNLSVQQQLPFSGFLMSTTPTITASATATLVDTGKYCLVALKNTTSPGITVGGSSQANLGCGAISNSTSTTASVDANGSTYSFAASPVASVGGMPSTIIGSTDLQPWHIPEPDPFAGKYSTSVPATTTCAAFNSHITKQTGGKNKTYTMEPGCYNDFSPNGNDTYNLAAGTYYLNSTDFAPGGTVTVTGSNVTIILTGSTPGAVNLSGNQTIQLSAPTTGTYAKMLFIQSSSATADNLNKINGTSSSYFDGAFYFPNGDVQLNGTAGAMTQCAMLVAQVVDISGNATLQNTLTRLDANGNTVPCDANQTVTAKVARLVE
jgi:Flp pilus assembly protein TadG